MSVNSARTNDGTDPLSRGSTEEGTDSIWWHRTKQGFVDGTTELGDQPCPRRTLPIPGDLRHESLRNNVTGNWNTLEVQPKLKGLDTRLELIKFYEKNYSANLMHLVVYARDGLDAIQSLVEQKFCDIKNSGRNNAYFPGQPCSPEHLQILVKAVRIKQGHILRVIWPIAPSIQNYKEGPCRYLSHLIGHEGEGSVFFILKQLGWALSLEAGEGDWSLEFSFFSVSIELTDKGHEHIEDIVGILFRYIDLLQNSGVNKWIFDEPPAHLLPLCPSADQAFLFPSSSLPTGRVWPLVSCCRPQEAPLASLIACRWSYLCFADRLPVELEKAREGNDALSARARRRRRGRLPSTQYRGRPCHRPEPPAVASSSAGHKAQEGESSLRRYFNPVHQ
ncbi:hypothetical protein ZIOFF_056752 [Zingiber officinale]|uniref:Peptidase M16 C-terminal domain-containing protein n=1 Tax=Zingiber officinale TaxID=94328 RepID=A0A8J5FE75_ZINOF|nr:hypothetical protein ZIOFF_056752 [Zingiber officinale]